MTRTTIVDSLPSAQKEIVLRKLRFIQEKMPALRRTPIFASFGRQMADELGVTETTISHVVTGRNKNPRFIDAIYQEIKGRTGDSDPQIEEAERLQASINPTLPNMEYRQIAAEAEFSEMEARNKLFEAQRLIRESIERYQRARTIWHKFDSKKTIKILVDLGRNDPDLHAKLGGDTQEGRLLMREFTLETLQGVLNDQVGYRESTREDTQKEAMTAPAGAYTDNYREFAISGFNSQEFRDLAHA